jgi:hypothetical protein
MAGLIERSVQGAMQWVDERAPSLKEGWDKHLSKYYAPKNFNFWYFFGSLAMLVLVNQIITGIWLTMNYNPVLPRVPLPRLNTSCGTWSTAGCCATCTPPAPRCSSLWSICTCSAA